jgi:hypothetical protein
MCPVMKVLREVKRAVIRLRSEAPHTQAGYRASRIFAVRRATARASASRPHVEKQQIERRWHDTP